MKRLVLVRHGETIWHAENRYAGRSDIALTEKGKEQANLLARWAATANLDAIWSSPLIRARETAEPAAKLTGLALRTEPRLAELDFGEGEGKTDHEMQALFPLERAAFCKDPAANFLPFGEAPVHAVARAIAGLRAISDALPEDGRALIVGHNTLARLLLCDLLGIPLSRYRTCFPTFANVALTEISLTEHGAALLAFNLPLHLATRY